MPTRNGKDYDLKEDNGEPTARVNRVRPTREKSGETDDKADTHAAINTNRVVIRDSFDRFGDDLCEELLRYVSLEMCLDCECVSKQFKRCLFSKQNTLLLRRNNSKEELKFENKLMAKLSDNRYDILNQLVVKCKAITSIEIGFNDFDLIDDMTCKIMATIIENCSHLTSFTFGDNWLFELIFSDILFVQLRNTWQLFGKKFGQSLRSISLKSLNKECIQSLLPLTPNLIKCHGIKLSHCLSDGKSVTLLPKLNTISASFDSKTDFKLFADQFANRIEKMDLDLSMTLRMPSLTTNIDMFTHLSRCKRLSLIRIIFTIYPLANDFQNLPSCPQLVDLHLRCFISEVILDGIQSFAPNLRSISFYYPNGVIDDNILTELNKLDLISVSFSVRKLTITDIALHDFITKCVRLAKINLQNLENLSETTIEAFISRANSNPKSYYSLNARLSTKDVERREEFKSLISYYKSIDNGLPKNLKLNIKSAY